MQPSLTSASHSSHASEPIRALSVRNPKACTLLSSRAQPEWSLQQCLPLPPATRCSMGTKLSCTQPFTPASLSAAQGGRQQAPIMMGLRARGRGGAHQMTNVGRSQKSGLGAKNPPWLLGSVPSLLMNSCARP